LTSVLPLSKARRYERIGLRQGLLVAWQSPGRRTVSRLATLGLGGVFIEAAEPAATGEGIKLLFRVAGGDVNARALVRDSRPGKGMGVEFISMRPEDRGRLGRLVRKLLAIPLREKEQFA